MILSSIIKPKIIRQFTLALFSNVTRIHAITPRLHRRRHFQWQHHTCLGQRRPPARPPLPRNPPPPLPHPDHRSCRRLGSAMISRQLIVVINMQVSSQTLYSITALGPPLGVVVYIWPLVGLGHPFYFLFLSFYGDR